MTMMSSSMMQRHRVVVFDLDDTLYKEVDFLKSGYRYLAKLLNETPFSMPYDEIYQTLWTTYQIGGNPFDEGICQYDLGSGIKEWMLDVYRHHFPAISLEEDVVQTLRELRSQRVKMGIITDGRIITQMNKIMALGLDAYVESEDIIINETRETMKPDERSFLQLENRYGHNSIFTYVGDNPAKDFIAPNSLGWNTICLLNDGRNIHKQDFSGDGFQMPQKIISKMIGNL